MQSSSFRIKPSITLVERVVNELEPNELEDVIITVSPGWHERMTEDQFKGLFENCDIQISEQLADGSIRLSIEDKSIEDLLEGRITEIASQVFDLKFLNQALYLKMVGGKT